MSKKIVIVDYSLGNMFSVQQAFAHFGINAIVTNNKQDIESADALVLPGVGAFAEAMNNLNSQDLVSSIRVSIQKGTPFLGICLGLQLLFDSSEEFGATKGLSIIPGTIKRFHFPNTKIKVPQMGWNNIIEPSENKWKNTALHDIKNNEYMYFVHSYYANPVNKEHVLCETEYEGIRYCSAVLKDNVMATQFHPEKSGIEGLKIYKNWIEKI
jgi:glutamine amidotransferase